MMKEFQLHRLHSTKTNWLNPGKNGGPPEKKLLSSNLLAKWLKLKHQVVQDCGPSTIRRSWSRDICWELCWNGLDFHNHQRKKCLKLGWSYPIRSLFFSYLLGLFCLGILLWVPSPKENDPLLNGDQKIPKHQAKAAIEHCSDGICQRNSFLSQMEEKNWKSILELGYLPLNSVKSTLTPCTLHSWVDILPKANRFCKLPKTSNRFFLQIRLVKYTYKGICMYIYICTFYVFDNLCHPDFFGNIFWPTKKNTSNKTHV